MNENESKIDIKNESNSNDRQALVYLKELILF
jgi:hypothetical protein